MSEDNNNDDKKELNSDTPENEVEEFEEQYDESDYTGDIDAYDLDAPESKLDKMKNFFSDTFEKVKLSTSKLFNRKKTIQLSSPSSANVEEIEREVKVTFKDQLSYKLKQLELGRMVQAVFDPDSRTRINQIAAITLSVVGIYGTGKMIALAIKGKESIVLSKVATQQLSPSSINDNEITAIKNNNIFKTSSGASSTPLVSKTKKFTPEKCKRATRPTSLPVKLINTVVLQDSIKSVASVQVRGKLESFREGENIQSMAKIDKITRLELIIKNLKSGECEVIRNDKVPRTTTPKISVMSPSQSRRYKRNQKKVKGITNDGNNFKIKKALLNDQLKDLSALLTQARAIKIENPDGTLSFKIVEIEPGSIFSTLGIQNEDVITHIGGDPIRSMNEIMSLFGKLRNLSSLQLRVNRMGSSSDLKYSFE